MVLDFQLECFSALFDGGIPQFSDLSRLFRLRRCLDKVVCCILLSFWPFLPVKCPRKWLVLFQVMATHSFVSYSPPILLFLSVEVYSALASHAYWCLFLAFHLLRSFSVSLIRVYIIPCVKFVYKFKGIPRFVGFCSRAFIPVAICFSSGWRYIWICRQNVRRLGYAGRTTGARRGSHYGNARGMF